MKDWEQMFRFSSLRIHQSLVQKPLRMEDFWPMRGDKKEDKMVMSRELYAEIKKAHHLN